MQSGQNERQSKSHNSLKRSRFLPARRRAPLGRSGGARSSSSRVSRRACDPCAATRAVGVMKRRALGRIESLNLFSALFWNLGSNLKKAPFGVANRSWVTELGEHDPVTACRWSAVPSACGRAAWWILESKQNNGFPWFGRNWLFFGPSPMRCGWTARPRPSPRGVPIGVEQTAELSTATETAEDPWPIRMRYHGIAWLHRLFVRRSALTRLTQRWALGLGGSVILPEADVSALLSMAQQR